MNMAQRRAAAAARIKELATAAAQPTKPRLRVRAGERITELMMKLALGIETAAQKLQRWAESKVEEHQLGGKCPHCQGTGRYRFHTDATRNERCFRCNGKGVIDDRDLGFLSRRLNGSGPVCWVRTAAV